MIMKLLEGETVGIDLGTTYSTMSQLDSDGNPISLKNADNKKTHPYLLQCTGIVVNERIDRHTSICSISSQHCIISSQLLHKLFSRCIKNWFAMFFFVCTNLHDYVVSVDDIYNDGWYIYVLYVENVCDFLCE